MKVVAVLVILFSLSGLTGCQTPPPYTVEPLHASRQVSSDNDSITSSINGVTYSLGVVHSRYLSELAFMFLLENDSGKPVNIGRDNFKVWVDGEPAELYTEKFMHRRAKIIKIGQFADVFGASMARQNTGGSLPGKAPTVAQRTAARDEADAINRQINSKEFQKNLQRAVEITAKTIDANRTLAKLLGGKSTVGWESTANLREVVRNPVNANVIDEIFMSRNYVRNEAVPVGRFTMRLINIHYRYVGNINKRVYKTNTPSEVRVLTNIGNRNFDYRFKFYVSEGAKKQN